MIRAITSMLFIGLLSCKNRESTALAVAGADNMQTKKSGLATYTEAANCTPKNPLDKGKLRLFVAKSPYDGQGLMMQDFVEQRRSLTLISEVKYFKNDDDTSMVFMAKIDGKDTIVQIQIPSDTTTPAQGVLKIPESGIATNYICDTI